MSGLEKKLSQVQTLFLNSPVSLTYHPDPFPLSECPAPLVGWFRVNMKEGEHKGKDPPPWLLETPWAPENADSMSLFAFDEVEL